MFNVELTGYRFARAAHAHKEHRPRTVSGICRGRCGSGDASSVEQASGWCGGHWRRHDSTNLLTGVLERLKPRFNRFALPRQDADDTLVHAAQRRSTHGALLRRSEEVGARNTQKAGGSVGTVVDVLIQEAAVMTCTGSIPNQYDRVNIE